MPSSPNIGDGHDFSRPPPTVNLHGGAALLLVESLIHGLIHRSVLSVDDAIKIIEIAADVESEQAADPANGGMLPIRQSQLMPMADSLRFDRGS